MKNIYAAITGTVLLAVIIFFSANKGDDDSYIIHLFEKKELSSTFYAEGAGIGDLNQDGHPDVISGPYWYEGPDFEDRHIFYEPHEFDPHDYSDNFIVEVDDVDEDGWNDILVIGFPGQEANWYKNPLGETSGEPTEWERHLIHPKVDNESPLFHDLTGNGKLDLVSHSGGYIGYAVPDDSDPTQQWTFNSVSEQRNLGEFTHGFGIGDVNGDGNEDILMHDGWWENPGELTAEDEWTYHEADFGPGGAQMYTYDLDDDGLNDVITSLDAHGWGLAWYRQEQDGNDDIRFAQHLIMGNPEENDPYGEGFSQPHSVALADMDNDGVKDILSGKRYWAHGPDGDPEPNAPAVLYWFKTERNSADSVSFIPYQIDDNSGAGVEIETGDLTGNGYPDVVTTNKKGTFIFLNRPDTVSQNEREDQQ